MGAAFTKKNKIFKRIDLNKLITIFVILVLILTSFTSISTADNINQNITQENPEPIREENDLNEEIEENTLYNSLPDPPKIGDLIKLFRELINFTKAYIEFRKEHPRYIINVSTNLNGYKKSTKLNFFRPTPVDVDDDGDKDIRIWIFRRPAIDFSSLSIALKTTYLIRRLPGLNDNITDFFEITLEYETSPLHYLFFVTKDIEKIRIGYQSPKGEEIPQNCLLIDKTNVIIYLIDIGHRQGIYK